MRKYGVLLICVCLILAIHSMASANTWNETGDAGDLVGTAQLTGGGGMLTDISGKLTSDLDIDLYQIYIVSPALFSAYKLGVQTTDPDLWLFDLAGNGITHNDKVNGGMTLITGTYVPAPGLYLLGISGQADAISGTNSIWNNASPLAERPPDGPGAAGSLTSWSVYGPVTTIPYTIYLAGAQFSRGGTAPEPSSLLGVLSGVVGLIGFGVRRRRSAA